jgi:DNA primase
MSGLLDIAAIRASQPISAIIGNSVKLRKAGREFVACCPFHNERSASFTVNDDKGFAHCFGCGWHGDGLDFIMAAHGVGLREAAERLTSGDLPVLAVRTPGPPPEPERDATAEAIAIWRGAVDAAGTPAETYLRSRGLHLPIPASIRFARLRYGSRGDLHPVLVSLITSAENKAIGVQRTYLKAGGMGKAAVPKPKLSLGRVRGGAIRLAPPAAELVVCEGMEDALTCQQELGRAAWAAAGASMLSSMCFPPIVESVVIGADSDAAGEREAGKAAAAFSGDGLRVRIMRPDGAKDFNEQLMKGGRS